jgi:hypothetical protein
MKLSDVTLEMEVKATNSFNLNYFIVKINKTTVWLEHRSGEKRMVGGKWIDEIILYKNIKISTLRPVSPLKFKMYKNPENMPEKLTFEEIDDEWKSRLSARWWSNNYTGELTELQKENFILINKILTFSGNIVCMGHGEESDLKELLSDGCFMYGKNSVIKKGAPISCHANSAKLWNKNKKDLSIMTGYALNVDGMWRQHTWCVQKSNNLIIETTGKRVAYYGFILNEEESKIFYNSN